MIFLDVGQGDCTVFADPSTRRGILIDCPSRAVTSVLEVVRRQGIVLDAVVVTHWDMDHYGGIARLAKHLRPQAVYYNHDTLFADPAMHRMIRGTLKQFLDSSVSGSGLNAYRAGDLIDIDGIRLRFLAPTQAEVTKAYVASKRNIASAVALVDVAGVRVMIGGDAVAATWTRLISEGENLKADWFRWPHHGAELHGDTTGEIAAKVLALIAPKALVVSVGASNVYRHPAGTVINTASAAGSRVMCTQVTRACLHRPASDGLVVETPGNAFDRATGAEVKCAGTIFIAVGADGVEVSPSPAAHDARIRSWPAPMCGGRPSNAVR